MLVGTILLTKDNIYLREDGKLPLRPEHDKELLKDICHNGRVSTRGYSMLPPSIQEVVETDDNILSVPITIKELAVADLLIVSRSLELCRGKVFRLDNFKCILRDRKIELWRKK